MKTVTLAAILALPLQALSAHPRLSSGVEERAEAIRAPHASAYAGEPRARIRKVNHSTGLGPLAFAQWLVRHHRLFPIETALLRHVSTSDDLVDRSADSFLLADRNGDWKISATELADFIAIDPAKAKLGRAGWAAKALRE